MSVKRSYYAEKGTLFLEIRTRISFLSLIQIIARTGMSLPRRWMSISPMKR